MPKECKPKANQWNSRLLSSATPALGSFHLKKAYDDKTEMAEWASPALRHFWGLILGFRYSEVIYAHPIRFSEYVDNI